MSKEDSKFGLGSIIIFGINCIVGGGIYMLPAAGYKSLGTNFFYMIIICSVLATIMGFAFAEMAGKFSETGGVYVYVRETFGPVIGFQIGFIRYIVGTLAISTEFVIIAQKAGDFVPWFLTTEGTSTIALIMMTILLFIIHAGGKSSKVFNNIIGVLKIAPIIFFIVSGIFFIKLSNFQMPAHIAGDKSVWNLETLSAGFFLAFYAFLGFENIGVAAQNMKNPKKNIPKGIIITMFIVTLFNLLVVVNAVGILGPALANTNNPVELATASYLGAMSKWIVFSGALIALVGISFTMAFSGILNIVPMAEDNFFPKSLIEKGKNGTPTKAILLFGFITMCITIGGTFLGNNTNVNTFELFAVAGTVGRVLQYIVVSLAVIPSRKKFPGTFILAGAKLLIPIAVIVCILAMLKVKLVELFFGVFGLFILSLGTYFLYSRPRYKKYHQS